MLIWTIFASLMPRQSVINLMLFLSPKQKMRSSLSSLFAIWNTLSFLWPWWSPRFLKNSFNSSLATHSSVSSGSFFSFPWYQKIDCQDHFSFSFFISLLGPHCTLHTLSMGYLTPVYIMISRDLPDNLIIQPNLAVTMGLVTTLCTYVNSVDIYIKAVRGR